VTRLWEGSRAFFVLFQRPLSSVADPDPRSGAFLTPRELKTILWVKKLKFFDADPGSEYGKKWKKHPGSAILPLRIVWSWLDCN
jgi:hypothetical protein